MSSHKQLTYSIRYDERDLNRRIVVKVSPARRWVSLVRTKADVLSSRAGTTVGCTNSNCALREAAAGAFPHPCYLAVFTTTSAYIVDRLDRRGQPSHAVWYKHDDGVSVDLNDTVQDRKLLARLLERESVVILRPPRRRNGIKNIYASGTHKQGPRDAETPRRSAVLRGALARARAAGLMVLPDV